MKITFPDQSYIEVSKSITDKIIITIAAKDHNNPLTTIANSVELTLEQFNKLIQLG